MTALGEYIAEANTAPTAPRHRSAQPSSHRLGPQIASSNVGYQLLQRAGWTEGQGLGSNQQGRPIPLAAYHQQARQGIGVSTQQAERQQRSQPDTARKRPASEGVEKADRGRQKQHLPVPNVPEDPHVKRQRHQQVCLLSSICLLSVCYLSAVVCPLSIYPSAANNLLSPACAICLLIPTTCLQLPARCYLPAGTRLLLSACCYLPAVTCLLLPSGRYCLLLSVCCYLPAVTRLQLPACCYLPTVTCLQLPACCYLPAVTCLLCPAGCCLQLSTIIGVACVYVSESSLWSLPDMPCTVATASVVDYRECW